MKISAGIVLSLCVVLSASGSPYPTIELAPELRTFVEPCTRPIVLAQADLDGDGRRDAVLVLEQTRECMDETTAPSRILLLLIRERNGCLRTKVRNPVAIGRADCGSAGGDCFDGVDARERGFDIQEYGLGGSRYQRVITFKYATRARTWLLHRVTNDTFRVGNYDKTFQREVYTRKQFGIITIEAYTGNPDQWSPPN